MMIHMQLWIHPTLGFQHVLKLVVFCISCMMLDVKLAKAALTDSTEAAELVMVSLVMVPLVMVPFMVMVLLSAITGGGNGRL